MGVVSDLRLTAAYAVVGRPAMCFSIDVRLAGPECPAHRVSSRGLPRSRFFPRLASFSPDAPDSVRQMRTPLPSHAGLRNGDPAQPESTEIRANAVGRRALLGRRSA